MEHPRFLNVSFFATTLIVMSNAWAYYFWDQGLSTATVKTAYESLSEGNSTNPITIARPFQTDTGCLWASWEPDLINKWQDDPDDYPSPLYTNGYSSGCPFSPTIYNSSNTWWQNGSWYSPNYWVLTLNNEPAFDPSNSGPPDKSLPRREPGAGIMGFTMIKDTAAGENFWRAALVLNLTFPNPHGDIGIPFLSIGAHNSRGNGGPVGALNPTSGIPYRVKFTAKLYDFLAPKYNNGANAAAIFQMWAVAEWGGKPRMLFLSLFHWNLEFGDGFSSLGLGRTWNWPIAENYLYPGADIAYIDAEDVQAACGFSMPRLNAVLGQQINYDINLQALFQCASNHGWFRDPLPTTQNIPIHGVHWSNEATGANGWLFTTVHGMQMY